MSALTNAEKREIQLQREAFIAGHKTGAFNSGWDAGKDHEALAITRAAARYPDPTEPTILSADDGRIQIRIHPNDGRLQCKFPDDVRWTNLPSFWTASLCMSLGEIAQEYYDNNPGKKS